MKPYLMHQQFKTLAGAQKRARFENAHCAQKFIYEPVRCVNGRPDLNALLTPNVTYTWRLRRTYRSKTND